ncbi:bifunctional N-acetylglucosamine-1-phosphate uridyltransferase / glucosamine-1-phosphate N-acetyltransferase [Legionella birminghamensis]|uniref:Bifunctional protein GlmU n=1 Tax=Legionella birminghamensis TaxID=28083 RepID=A0A378IDS6_9GAMM|nr:bifunctional UDP-N-acetylglucosamine diphosphorylase/glucosamine-1-phosphate N-acetyltransferase GlmU [Legionella birminghamensis]KTC68875.1 bifunctional N-acetylglucosamine-1-phosphate uridyltransferase / glucosamine-1-phosphate N-acetyltransferase [Legionella birminghamensis]STX33183.1 UDP-N-acetylglucosamine pyrophosphorylase [Legionella birminghamensis]
MSLHIIILAAGMGKRMYSNTPKVLHKLAGKPMLSWVVEAAQSLKPEAVHIIYGNGGALVREALSSLDVNWVLQEKQLGTGHAVMQALPFIPDESRVLILSADVPLISVDTLEHLIRQSGSFNQLSLLLANLDNPFGLGRILRDGNSAIYGIVEEKDANEQQKQIKEIYSGICCANAGDLKRWLPKLGSNNAQGEYYLTDIIALAVQEEQMVQSITARDNIEIQGVNNQLQLQQLERIWQQRQAEKLLLSGVSIADAARLDIRGELVCGKDVFIDVNCVFIGKVILEDGCQVGPNCFIRNSSIGVGTEILPGSVIDQAEIAAQCQIGPYARLRPGTRLASFCKIGNFVETKNALLDEHSKASHLSYLGDVRIGRDVNIGAGTITCNYDGVNKHQTIIEDGVFVGSDTQLVAPVTIGTNATIGAGSTIRKNVPADELTLSENRQKTVYGWKRPVKEEKR